MSNRAWVTLATNDSYGLGALVLAHSLRRASSIYPAAVLITPSVTEAMRERLRAVFAEVVVVDVLDSRDAAHLALLQRPELGITFTKIHCWGLTQYEKCVFLDADTLIVQNCDELFEREELSAAPDVGWPDCFNSGVFVYKPSQETLEQLIKFAQERGSFDGGDQGLLNSFFSDWARGDINKHLPFLYNVTSAAFYSYIPALKHYGQNLKIIHFIGATKPWLQQFNWESRSVDAPEHLREFLQLWWDLFVGQVHSQLDVTMSGVAGNLARVVPGAASFQREALDELTRRQGWEAGNIDYMGADSFDNIWAKISQTLSKPRVSPPKQPSPPKEPSPPKQPSPPKEPSPPKQPSPPKEIPVEVAQEATAIDAASTPASEPVVEAVSETPVAAEVKPVVEAAPAEAPQAAPAPVETVPTPVEAAPAPVEAVPAPVKSAPTPVESAPKLAESASAPVESAPAPVEATPAPVEATPVPVKAAPVAEAPKSVDAAPTEVVAAPAPVEVETKPAEKAPVASETKPVPTHVEAAPAPQVEARVAAEAPVAAAVPVASEPEIATTVAAASKVKSAEIPAKVEESAATPPEAKEKSATVEASAAGEQPKKKTSKTEPALPPTPPESPKSEEKAAPVKAAKEASPVAPLPVTTPEKSSEATVCSDSPPLANTPSKDEAPTLPAAKSTEEAAQETRL